MKSVVKVSAAVIRRGNRVLLTSRPENKPPAGWEFPGGKLEPGESFAAALRRELREELGVEAAVTDELYRCDTGRVELCFLRAVIPDMAGIVPREGQSIHWTELSAEPPPELLAADRRFWNYLVGGRSSELPEKFRS